MTTTTRTLLLQARDAMSAPVGKATGSLIQFSDASESAKIIATAMAEQAFKGLGEESTRLVPHIGRIADKFVDLAESSEETAQKILDARKKMDEYGATQAQQVAGFEETVRVANKYGISITRVSEVLEDLAIDTNQAEVATANVERATKLMLATNLRAGEAAGKTADTLRGETAALNEMRGPAARVGKLVDELGDQQLRAREATRALDRALVSNTSTLDKVKDKLTLLRIRAAEGAGGFDVLGGAAKGAGLVLAAVTATIGAIALATANYVKSGLTLWVEETDEATEANERFAFSNRELQRTIGEVTANAVDYESSVGVLAAGLDIVTREIKDLQSITIDHDAAGQALLTTTRALAIAFPGLGTVIDDAVNDRLAKSGRLWGENDDVMNTMLLTTRTLTTSYPLLGIATQDMVEELNVMRSVSAQAEAALSGVKNEVTGLADSIRVGVEQISAFETFFEKAQKRSEQAVTARARRQKAASQKRAKEEEDLEKQRQRAFQRAADDRAETLEQSREMLARVEEQRNEAAQQAALGALTPDGGGLSGALGAPGEDGGAGAAAGAFAEQLDGIPVKVDLAQGAVMNLANAFMVMADASTQGKDGLKAFGEAFQVGLGGLLVNTGQAYMLLATGELAIAAGIANPFALLGIGGALVALGTVMSSSAKTGASKNAGTKGTAKSTIDAFLSHADSRFQEQDRDDREYFHRFSGGNLEAVIAQSVSRSLRRGGIMNVEGHPVFGG